jgi:hypothetical protein
MDVRHALSAVLRYACDRGTLTATVLLAPVQEPSLQRLDCIRLGARSRSVVTMVELSLDYRRRLE